MHGQHRAIWLITGTVVLLTAATLAVREIGQRASAHRELDAAGTQVRAMLRCLDADPSAEHEATKAAVKAVAALARTGVLDSAETRYALALFATEQELFEAAEAAFREAIALKPGWSWPYSGLGVLLANHTPGRTREAEEAFRQAIRLDPNWSRPHDNLAVLLRMADRFDEAESQALAALALAPNSVAAHNNYGNLLVTCKRLDEAEPHYLKAIELAPRHPKPYYNLACLYSLEDNGDKAIPLLAKAIELDDVFSEEACEDPDFDNIRNDPAFRALVRGLARE